MARMRHSCDTHGCYLKRHVLKFDVFDGLFPRDINFSDIDACVEYQARFLEMEWKNAKECITNGQKMMIRRKTKKGFVTFLVVIGNPETMRCTEFQIWYDGKPSKWIRGNLEDLKLAIIRWRNYVEGLKAA